jgi:ATP-dependent Lon protease
MSKNKIKKTNKNEDRDSSYSEEEDEDYIDNKKSDNQEKKIVYNFPETKIRRNSEGDLYGTQIRERSKHDLYFKRQKRDKQIDILDKEHEIYNYFYSDTPLRYKIIYSNLSLSMKSLILQKIDMHEMMDKTENEYNKLTKWLNGLAQIPFDNYVKMPVFISDGDKKIQTFLYNSYEILKNTIYGQNDAKNKIMQILAQWITNPNSLGQVIALEGSPGVGKTSLIKNGVSKALGRPFSFYALGGETDVSNLEGHSYTYEGAMWGRIIEMLMEAKVMNPVIFFDELDKISATVKGNEINGLLTHLTDPSQNTIFHDKYFSGIDIDLSKAIFFFSFNDIELINPILKDRLTIVKFKGYTNDEKINIVKDFIMPDLLKNIGFEKDDIKISNDIIKYILCKTDKKEDGVRTIKKYIEELLMKINLLKLMKTKNNKNEMNIDYHIEDLVFPLNITTEISDKLLFKIFDKKEKDT